MAINGVLVPVHNAVQFDRISVPMHNVFNWSALLAALLLAAAVRAEPVEDEAALAALLDAFLAGASVNDAEMHERFWHDDLVYTSSSGTRRGKPEIMAGVRSAAPSDPESMPSYRGEDVEIRIREDTAIMTFRLVAETPGGSPDEYFNTGVFARSDPGWQAIAWQATRIPEAAAD